MKITLLIAGFTISTFVMAFSALVTVFAWSMADFDCVDGYWSCRRHLPASLALPVGLPFAVWLALAVLLRREWKKG